MTVAASHPRQRVLRVAIAGLVVSVAAGIASPATGFGAPGLRSHKYKRPSKPAPGAPQTSAPAAGPASLAFMGLSEGQAVRRRATFRVRLANFAVCPTPTPSRLVPGQGFLHFSMDNGAFDVPGYSANGAEAVRAGTQGRYSPVRGTFLTYSGLPPGRHTLRVSLADNFHAETGVSVSVSFLVR